MTKFTLRPSNQIGPDESEILKESLQVSNQHGDTAPQVSTDGIKDKQTGILDISCTEKANSLENYTAENSLTNISHTEAMTSPVSNNTEQELIGVKRKRGDQVDDVTKDTEVLASKICKCNASSQLGNKLGTADANESSSTCCCSTASSEKAPRYPRVVFLGTGSCIPSKYRNVSSILIHTR